MGAFKASVLWTCLASLGLIAATIYSLRIIQKVFVGHKNTEWKMDDLSIREKLVSAALVISIVWLGLYPKPVLDAAKPAIIKTLNKQKEISIINTPSSVSVPLCGSSVFQKKELTQRTTEIKIN
jgi:NADH:ubiquinone oxidoreductase subunit 4 (subunit M)